MFKKLIALLILLSTPTLVFGVESYSGKSVEQIEVKVMNLPPGKSVDTHAIMSGLETKEGDPFSQTIFDRDLKQLSERYERVDPSIRVEDGKLIIVLRLWEKPYIQSIVWHGNKGLKTKKLQAELDIEPHTILDRTALSKGLTKVKDLYIKKSYYEVSLNYKVTPIKDSNEVRVDIYVKEGPNAKVGRIVFEGFSDEEKTQLRAMINSKSYNLFTSWITGTGIYHQEMLEHDRMTVINFLQNKGYADAHVTIQVKESEISDNRVWIVVKADRGEVYHFGDISFSGNKIYDQTKVEKRLIIKRGDIYSPDTLRAAVDQIKDLYGHEGYIETSVQYELSLDHSEPVYDVHFTIEESEQFRIGVIRVLGNTSTQSNVILNESQLVPGEVFDERKLKSTQGRLQAIGYFKSVNVYAVRSGDDQSLGSEYRDVIIEVEEGMTGNMSMFFGASSTDSIFGGLDISENNFSWHGLTNWWREGISSFRGGGQFFSMKFSIGKKDGSVDISWTDPYFCDSLWRVGFDLGYSQSRLQSADFLVAAYNLNLYGSHPISSYLSAGVTARVRDSRVNVKNRASPGAQKQQQNSGVVYGTGPYLSYDSTDHPIMPHRGLRSSVAFEGDGVHRRRKGKVFVQNADGVYVQQTLTPEEKGPSNIGFIKMNSLNSYYYPVWRKGTLKLKADFNFLQTFNGNPSNLPTNERYFLGGETTVRGYKPAIIGPSFKVFDTATGVLQEKDPEGGATAALFSAEYQQNIIKIVDLFAFFDAGAVSIKEYKVGKFRMSYGCGARLSVGGGRLPMMIGVGFPINPEDRDFDTQKFFFSMGGQF